MNACWMNVEGGWGTNRGSNTLPEDGMSRSDVWKVRCMPSMCHRASTAEIQAQPRTTCTSSTSLCALTRVSNLPRFFLPAWPHLLGQTGNWVAHRYLLFLGLYICFGGSVISCYECFTNCGRLTIGTGIPAVQFQIRCEIVKSGARSCGNHPPVDPNAAFAFAFDTLVLPLLLHHPSQHPVARHQHVSECPGPSLIASKL